MTGNRDLMTVDLTSALEHKQILSAILAECSLLGAYWTFHNLTATRMQSAKGQL
jgi:hypothetical protein